MLSDDIFRSRLATTISELQGWLTTLNGAAAVDTARDAASWRATVRPRIAQACPFEIVLRADQLLDLAVGSEVYEDEAIMQLDEIQPMLAAIADGRVVTRAWRTLATGTPVKVETLILAKSDGQSPLWQRTRTILSGRDLRWSELVATDRRYAPYARGA